MRWLISSVWLLIHLQFLICQLRKIYLQDSSVLNLREADQSQVTPARQLHQLLDDFLKHGPAFTKLSLGWLVPLPAHYSVEKISTKLLKQNLTLVFALQSFHQTAGRFSLQSGTIFDNSKKNIYKMLFHYHFFYFVDQKNIVFRVGFDELQQDSENLVLKRMFQLTK